MDLNMHGYEIRQQKIIRVKEVYENAPGPGDPGLKGGQLTGIFFSRDEGISDPVVFPAQFVDRPGDDFHRIVGGTIIDDDTFERTVCLSVDAFQCVPDVFRVVVGSYYDRNQRSLQFCAHFSAPNFWRISLLR